MLSNPITTTHARLFRLQVLLLTFFFQLFSLVLNAATTQAQKVRVGWFDSGFNRTDNTGRRSGYAYDYQIRIAANTGWEYEYVNGSWPELFQKLQRGEIDLLADVSYSAERTSSMLFSELSMGTEDYSIYKLTDNQEISLGEVSTLVGKRVAVFRGSIQMQQIMEWKERHNIDITIVPTSKGELEILEMLKQGKVDAIVSATTINLTTPGLCLPVTHIGSSDIFFAVNKNRPDLKFELDRAMSKIRSHNVYYNSELHEKYFSRVNIHRYLPVGEEEWIKNHGTITIGYRDNYLPFCAKDASTGEVRGLLFDFIEKVKSTYSYLDIQIKAIAYPTINEAFEALHRGEVDVAFPSGMNAYDSEQANLLTTDFYIKSAEMAVVRGNDNFHANGKVRAALNADNPNYLSLVHQQYPNWEIVRFGNTHECLQGVAEGKADLLLTSNYRLGVLSHEISALGLKAVATGSTIPLAFATDRGNSELFSIFCRFIRLLPDSEIYASLSKYSVTTSTMSINDFLRNHLGIVSLSLLVTLGVFIFLLYHSRKEHQKAVDANLAKTRFLFSMSHDIRTPMNAIIGYSDLMAKHLDDTPRCQDYLKKIRSSSDFLLGLINNVLELARIESGKVEINEQPWLIGKVLNEVLSIYVDLMKQKGIQFEHYSTVKTRAIYCDRIRLNEVYLNLLSNAYKYTPKGGKVILKSCELPCEEEGYTILQATISDTGMGMSAEYLPTLFDDFTREKSVTDSKIQGTGLGMPIVKRLVTLMKGTITVESELGKGTTFVLTIPHKIANPEELHKDVTTQIDVDTYKGKHILMAEDNDLNAEIATEVLSAYGFIVDRVEDGVACVEKLEQMPADTYDIVLMDIQMPRLNGFDATRKIRDLNDKAKCNIPIVAMTANAFDEDRKAALAAGMNAHLAKPIEIDKLEKTIAQLLPG